MANYDFTCRTMEWTINITGGGKTERTAFTDSGLIVMSPLVALKCCVMFWIHLLADYSTLHADCKRMSGIEQQLDVIQCVLAAYKLDILAEYISDLH